MSGIPIKQLSGNSNDIALPVAFLKNGIYLQLLRQMKGKSYEK
jgi:hypothetical protein